jgi:cell division protein FtsA
MTVYDTIPITYEVDHNEMENPEGVKGNYIHGSYYLVVGSSQMKLQFNKCMERIGIYNVEYMPLSAEAFSIAVTEEHERTEGCAVINFGGTSTTLAIYKGEILEDLMVVPFGGKHISRDLEEYGISESLAEKLKCSRGFAAEKYVDKPVNIKIPAIKSGAEPVVVTNLVVSMIIEARLEEILQPILKMIKRYKSELKHGLIITGGGASLQGLNEYLQEKTGLPSRLGDHSGWLTSDTPVIYQKPEYSQLIGTILLTHDYRQLSKKTSINDVSGTKKKSPRRSIGDAITQGIFRFFEEDTELQEPDEKTGKSPE